jgi:ribosome-binding protein aMBF1 (putative translation factor)
MSRTTKTAGRKVRAIPHRVALAAFRKRPGYQAAYDALEEEFSIIDALIRARTEAGLTQEQVAARMHSTQPAIARLESGGRIPSTRTLKRYAEATGHRLKIVLEPIARKERPARVPR